MAVANPAPGEYSWRARAAAAIILLMSAFAFCTLASYYWQLTRNSGENNAIEAKGIVIDENRFAALRAILPPRGTVGYLSDAGSKQENAKAYYLTQYYLAPVVVAPDAAHDLVVANFASPSAIARLAAANGLTVTTEFPNGVALLGRRSQ